MRSARLAKALAKGSVYIRNNRTGQVILKFHSPTAKDRIFSPTPLTDLNKKESYINLSNLYTTEQLKASTLEDLLLSQDLDLGDF